MSRGRPESGPRELRPELSVEDKVRLHRHAVALFDDERYFESHEPWEEIWRSTTPEPRDLWQGLVQVAAGLHHWFDHGRAAAAARLLRRGLARLERFGSQDVDFDLPSLTATLSRWAHWLEQGAEGEPPRAPRIRPVGRGGSR